MARIRVRSAGPARFRTSGIPWIPAAASLLPSECFSKRPTSFSCDYQHRAVYPTHPTDCAESVSPQVGSHARQPAAPGSWTVTGPGLCSNGAQLYCVRFGRLTYVRNRLDERFTALPEAPSLANFAALEVTLAAARISDAPSSQAPRIAFFSTRQAGTPISRHALSIAIIKMGMSPDQSGGIWNPL